ncbi:MAG: signal peptide peptidase SppA [Bacteroidales bacterium]|nr:signal peptide peptidase SppA [Bacteroidales bacterium]
MSEKKHPSFGKIMLASGVGTLIVLLIVGVFKLLLFFGVVGSLSTSSTAAVSNSSFLKLDLTKPMAERTPDDLESMLSDGSSVGFNDMLRSIIAAADDPKIKGIYLYMGSGYAFSWGKSEELRKTLERFCDSGKPILAYADGYTQQGYFVATVADSIYLNPSGLVEFRGIGAESLFFKEMLDKLAVKMTLVRPKSNNYKSAGEIYTMNKLSDANRTQIREYIKSIWEYVVDQISEARDISPEQLNHLASELDAVLPEDALANNLVDRLCFESDILDVMDNVYGRKSTVSLGDYSKTLLPKTISKDRIAVIYAEGDVITGTGFNTAVYSDKITKALLDAADDDKIKAIVLRVNSPGGAVTASEIMTNAVMRVKEKKPIIVSMGDVAASAGYEISCNANYIVAEPTTITGSIGVFAAIPEVGGTLKKYLGITTDTIMTNKNSTALSVMRPLSPKTLELMQRNVEDFYQVFIGRVAKGRGLDPHYVDSIARGRVWTGRDALKLGLVDALGGLDDAICIAADSAGLKQYQVVDYPAVESLFDQIANRKDKSEGIIHAIAPIATGDAVWMPGAVMINTLNRICETRGLQARVEFFIVND